MLEIRFARIEWTTSSGEVTTVTEVTPPCKLISYVPQAPSLRIARAQMTVGAWPVQHEVGNVTETIEIVAGQDAPTRLRTLNGTLARARYWAEDFRRDMRTVIQVRDVTRHGATWYEAPLYGGQVSLADGGGRVMQMQIERGPYWQGAEELLQVMNSGTGWTFTNQATIYNSDDEQPGHNNWVLVEAPPGDVPTPARLLIQNSYGVDERLAQIYIGWSNRPQALTLEGEESEGEKELRPDLEYSNGAAARSTIFKWIVTNTGLTDYVGMFKVLAQGQLLGRWRVGLGYEFTKLQQARWVNGNVGWGWTDLGNVVLPPGQYSHPVRRPMTVWVEGDRPGWLDFVLFLPLGHVQNRRLKFIGYNALPGACVEDDGIRDELVYQIGEERMPILEHFGNEIFLWPDIMLPQSLPAGTTPPNAQMLSFALQNDFGDAEAQRTAQVQVYARPWYEIIP